MMHIGALQLPLVIVFAVVMKMAIATNTSSSMLVASLLGLVVNVATNMILVDRFGVVGISVGMLLACTISTTYLLVVTRKDCGLHLTDVSMLIVGWGVWIGLCLAVSFESPASISCALIGLICLAWLQRRAFNNATQN